MKKSDNISGVVILIAAILIYFWIIPSQVDNRNSFGLIHPDFFPNLSAIFLIVLAGVQLISGLRQSFSKSASKIKQENDSSIDGEAINLKNIVHITLMAGISGLILFLFYWIGYFAAAPVTIIALMIAHRGERNNRQILITTVFVPLVIYIFVRFVFDIPLP